MALRFRGLDQSIQCVYAKDSGSAPQPVDPYAQAGAQYGLNTGTALFNAGLNRTNEVNPMGSSTWSANYNYPTSAVPGQPGTGAPAPPVQGPRPIGHVPTPMQPPMRTAQGGMTNGGGLPAAYRAPNITPGGMTYGQGGYGGSAPFGLGGSPAYATGGGPGGRPLPAGGGNFVRPTAPARGSQYGGAPVYTHVTTLAPQFQGVLDKPIDTSGLPGMPGGPNIQQNLDAVEKAQYDKQMGYLGPEQKLASEALDSQLAAQGLRPGSEAYNNEKDRISREQNFQTQQARDDAILAGGQEQSRLFQLGTQGLTNQITARNAPLNEYEVLAGNGAGAQATAQNPDISGAFGQQYQGQLAGYNANVASNNQTNSSLASAALAAALIF